MTAKLAQFRPLTALRCLRVSYRRALTVRELEARAALAAARQENAVEAILAAGAAMTAGAA